MGCLLSPFLFLLTIDWIMKTATEKRRNRIQWTPWAQLNDLDFTDDLSTSLIHQGPNAEENQRSGRNISSDYLY